LSGAVFGVARARNKTPRVFARRFGTRHEAPQIISSDIITAELGERARGFALDQRLRESEIAALA
jgi:hypothetical protein